MSEFRFNEDARPAFQPWQQSARMGRVVEAWRARSAASGQALADAQGSEVIGNPDLPLLSTGFMDPGVEGSMTPTQSLCAQGTDGGRSGQ